MGLTHSQISSHPYRNTPALSWNSTLQTDKSLEASATQVGTGKEGFYGTTITGSLPDRLTITEFAVRENKIPRYFGTNLQLWFDASDSSTISHSSNAVLNMEG